MKLDLRNPMRLLYAMLFAFTLAACADLQPTNMAESLAAMEVSATTARQAGQQAALAGKLKKSQAQFIQNQADLVVDGVKATRDLAGQAQVDQYEATQAVLRVLQTYLTKQGVKP